VVGEIFFTHERGRAMVMIQTLLLSNLKFFSNTSQGFYTVCICLGPIIGGISGGYIAGNQGLAWIHWVNVILSAVLLIACLIIVPETRYMRDQTQVSSPNDKSAEVEIKGGTEVVEDMAAQAPGSHSTKYANPSSMWKLNKYQGDAWNTFLAPWKTFRLPGVWLVMFWYAGLVGGVVTVTTVAPTIISEPPYLWGNNAGLIMIGGIIGALLGLIATSLAADRVITTKKMLRGEVFAEPEARLPVAIPGLLLATTGLWTFGFCAQNPGPPHMWVGMQFGIGMLCFGLMQAPSIGFNYVSPEIALGFQVSSLLINMLASDSSSMLMALFLRTVLWQ
jgi:MFS family permease